MDNEQVLRTLNWLDEERRKDKAQIAALQERVVDLEKRLLEQHKRVQEVDTNLSAVAGTIPRPARIDESLDKLRGDLLKQIETVETRRANSEREAEKLRNLDREAINKNLAALRKGLEPLPQVQKDVQARREEEGRLTREMRELTLKVADYAKLDEDRARSQTLLDEGRRQDNRRIADLQSEYADLRKKLDELRPRIEGLEDPIRRMEARVNEVVQAESERRTQQISFIEQQALVNAERERAWADWQTRLDALHAEAEDFSRQMENYSETHRNMKKLIDSFQPILDRLERRINEAGEMQRLAEDRFRQEWAAFQADEQKRWTTHMLLRDEQWRENDRQLQRVLDRTAAVEEHISEVRDLVRDIPEVDQRRLQSLLNLVRDWVAEHEQTFVQVR